MKKKKEQNLPIGLAFQSLPFETIRWVKESFIEKGYSIIRINKSTPYKILRSCSLIFLFLPVFADGDPDLLQHIVLSGRSEPYEMGVFPRTPKDGQVDEWLLENILDEISHLKEVYLLPALLEGQEEKAVALYKKSQAYLEKRGFKVLDPLSKNPKSLYAQERIASSKAASVVLSFSTKKEFDSLASFYQDEEQFFKRYEAYAYFLYVGQGRIPLASLTYPVFFLPRESLEDSLLAFERRLFAHRLNP
jgi:hypothetical protein